MLCQNCGKNEATTHYHSVINGVVKDQYLCSECAAKEKHTALENDDLFKMLSLFLNDGTAPRAEALKCDCCGTTFSEIRRTGRVGCGNCYKTFEKQLMPTLQRIHGRVTHIGKCPDSIANAVPEQSKTEKPMDEKQQKLDGLRAELKKAIETENYEKAAEIRDLIRKEEA